MRRLVSAGVVAAATALLACGGSGSGLGEARAQASADAKPSNVSSDVREAALAAARVWSPPADPISQVNLRDNPPDPGGFAADQDISCRFKIQEVSGTTPKFYCELPSGEILKVKYGSANAELPAEVAGTRLLAALGFGADRMYVVRKIRCAGCPTYPFYALRCLQEVGMRRACLAGGIDYTQHVDFDSVVIERRLEGRKIEATSGQGWAWYELEKIDPKRGGSPLAEVDALRLMAAFVAHWDNKSENQRLFCPPGADGADGSCAHPRAIIQDAGAMFGPAKLDLHNWRRTHVWADGATCTVSMKSLPFNGATFPERRISEQGRRMLLGLLEQLSDQQLRDLFEGSRVTDFGHISADARHAGAWVNTFKEKVQQIRAAGPCQ